jgi:hypothetical protein
MRKFTLAIIAVVALLAMAATPAFAGGVTWSNPLDSNISGWDNAAISVIVGSPIGNPWGGSPVITAAPYSGSYGGATISSPADFAVMGPNSSNGTNYQAYTDFGNTSPGVFGNGFTTSLSVYLVPASEADNTGMYWNVNLGNASPPDGDSVQFSFLTGSYGGTDYISQVLGEGSYGASTGSLISQNGFTAAGWYTYTDQFYDAGGYLAANLSVSDSSGSIGSWNFVTTTPVSSLEGGPATAWGLLESPTVLAFDNSSLTYATPEPISMIFFGTGLVAVGGYMARRKMARKA